MKMQEKQAVANFIANIFEWLVGKERLPVDINKKLGIP